MAEALSTTAGLAGFPSGERQEAPPAVAATTLVVENMHCGGCLRKVETALSAMPGVTSARANLSARRVTVVQAKEGNSTQSLIEALAAAGYKAAELAGEAEDTQKRADEMFLRRLAVAGFAAANIMLLSVSVWSGATGDMPHSMQALFHWLSALIALPAVAYSGEPFFRSARGALLARRLNMDVPISLGVILATGMSLYQTVAGSEQVYFDAAVTLLFFLLVGRYLDQRMRTRAAGAAANLLGLAASSATVIEADGTTHRLSARALLPGMRVLAATGERIAVDGVVEKGQGEIDESLITGETRPKPVVAGRRVHAGTLNLGGPLVVRASATDQGTLLAEIGRLMAAAEQGKSRYVRLADRAAALYAPAVHILGLATFIGWLVTGHGPEAALTAAIAVLIITCPCALALAVPAVQVAATSRLFSRGVIVKAADGLERLAEVDTVVLDKTGTLTLPEPRLAEGASFHDTVLARAAALAVVSRHPYARAVVAAARARGLEVKTAEGAVETAGSGVEAHGPKGAERLGSARWCGLVQGTVEEASLYYRPADGPAVPLAVEERPRPDARTTVSRLEAMGLWVEVLSGDQAPAAQDMASAAGIRVVRAGATPSDKIARLEALKAAGRLVVMVGDGLNDAPALAAAHASLSPSTAADISQTAADAVFQGEALGPVAEAIAVARASRRMAVENFAIAIGYNAVFVPLAVTGHVTPLIAAVAMSASSIAVTANAVRLRHRRLAGAPAAGEVREERS